MDAVGERHCLSCAYILNGLAENRCPECGRAFDPADATTFVLGRERKSGLRYLTRAVIYLLCALSLPVLRSDLAILPFGFGLVMLVGVTFDCVVLLRRPPACARRRWAVVLALVIALGAWLSLYLTILIADMSCWR